MPHMSIPYVRGRTITQAHVGVPDGIYEEEYGRAGFAGRYAHLYRTEAPVNWTRIEGPMRPRAFDLRERASDRARTPLLMNADVTVSIARLQTPMDHFFRNADADEVFFVHEGSGRIETDFGPLSYESGDYLLLPRGTTYRLAPSSVSTYLITETSGEVGFIERGLLGQHALFDPAVIRVPTPEPSVAKADANGEYEVRVKRLGEITRVYYAFCPLNVVGWKGTACVQQLNIRDIRPVMSERYHLPPTAHATFVASNVVICTFLPRSLENGDPAAMKVPFYHSNIDYDEVLFYHAGEFFSRQGISPGMLTLHPQGIQHGPQPGAAERAKAATRTEEVAIMIDTRNPLRVCSEANGFEIADYWKSWTTPVAKKANT
ncbi:MAG: homogentisate 1,2-dioxygenase [Sandaracinaceae bacterium]|nr:homogentisate 1,2-dioxygenase [Sandaracinaceae bacterium]